MANAIPLRIGQINQTGDVDALFLPSHGLSKDLVVGGWLVGAAGQVGSLYEGYTLSWADDFDTLDIVGPQNPTARFFPTGAYHPGIRGNTSSLGSAQDVDPLWTGYLDSNRGQPIGFNNMSVLNSVLHLGARKATALEQAHFVPTDPSINGGVRPQVSSMVHTGGAVAWYPTTNPVIVEFKAAFSSKATNPAGWHPALWFYALMQRAASGNEIDFEGSSQALYMEMIDHTSGVITTSGSAGSFDYFDGVFRVYTAVFQNAASGGTGPTKFYVDGVLKATLNFDSNSHASPSTALLTSHILTGTFNGDTYSTAAWAASATGAEIAVDWMRVARKSTSKHWKPLGAIADVNVAYNGSANIALPSKLTLWGDATVVEDVQVMPYDAAEPGMSSTVTFSQFPAGITYNSGTRTLSVDFTAGTDNAGRSHVVIYGYTADGSTMEPLRFCINRGPNITATTLEPTFDAGGNLTCDLYYAADVGKIFPKTYSVSDLPAGWTFNPATSKLSSPAPNSGGTITVTVTNGVGQSASKSVDMWSPALFGTDLTFAWDTTKNASAVNDGSSKAQFLVDIYDTTKKIAQTTSANRPVIATNGGTTGDKRVLSYLANGVSLRSDDAAAANAGVITAYADTADARTGNLYLVLAAKESAISTVNRILGWFNTAGTQFLAVRYTTTGRGVSIQGNGGSAQNADQSVQDTSWHVFEVIKTAASVVFKMDGVQVATATITQTGGIASNLFILGGAQSGGAFVGSIGPGVLVKASTTAANQNGARKWVASRMAITVV